LTKSFGDGKTQTRAVDDVSLDLHAGQVVVLMGPSGSGKSTLLAILSGLLRRTVARSSPWGRTCGSFPTMTGRSSGCATAASVFQGFNLFPSMSARQQLEIVLRLGEHTPAHEAHRRADELLDLLGLGDKAQHAPPKCPAARSSAWPSPVP